MKVSVKNTVIQSSGKDGLRAEGDIDLEIEGVHFLDNGEHGMNLVGPAAPLMRELGLPEDTNPRELAELLMQIQGRSKAEGEVLIKKSTFLEKFDGVTNVTTITNNLLQLAANPNVLQIITYLWSQGS